MFFIHFCQVMLLSHSNAAETASATGSEGIYENWEFSGYFGPTAQMHMFSV